MADFTSTPAAKIQGTTRSPQSVTAAPAMGASKQSGSVQPGTTASALRSSDGLSLERSSPTLISLDKTASTTSRTQVSSHVAKPAHHFNAAYIGIAVVLVLIVIGISWAITRSANNTTD